MRIHIRRSVLIIALLSIFSMFIPTAQAAPGDLDTSFAGFGSGGKAGLTGLQMPSDFGGMALAPDGKIVMVGHNDTQLLIWRYLPNGQPDPSFGNAGLYAYTPEGYDTIPTDVAVQPDGKIVIVGRNSYSFGDASDFLLLRVLADGSNLDSSLNGDGYVFTNFAGKDDEANAVLIQPDGKIVVGGEAEAGNDTDFAVARYLPSGTPDNSFDNDGKLTMDFGFSFAEAHAIARQNDGKLVLVGNGGGSSVLLRLTDAGAPDTSFDGDGKVIADLEPNVFEFANAVAVQPNDGKIVAVVNTFPGNSQRGVLARFESDGSLDDASDGDGGFNSDGKLFLDPGSTRLRDVALQPDGKILALGQHTDGSGNFFFYRAHANGTDDLTFGTNGVAKVGFGGTEGGTDLALLPDARILGFGVQASSSSAPITGLVLTRLWPDGTLDTGGQQTHSIVAGATYPSGSKESARAMAVQSDGKLLVAGQLSDPASTTSAAFLTRFLPTGEVDLGFGAHGTTIAQGGVVNAARAIALQPDGKIVIAGHTLGNDGTFDFLLARFHPDGALDNEWGIKTIPFGSGADMAHALAVTPDRKIVVVGSVSVGGRQAWGVVRLTSDGQPDPSFGNAQNGKVVVQFDDINFPSAVVVQGDSKIIIGGNYKSDFFLQRLLVNGERDAAYGINGGGYNITDMGDVDTLTALVLAPNGTLYAGGHINRLEAGSDIALAQYGPDGLLVECPIDESCWPQGKRIINLGATDGAFALALRPDNQLVAAGCSDGHMAAAQVSTSNIFSSPLLFHTDFVGSSDCAYGVGITGPGQNKIVLAGQQFDAGDSNIALAQFQTTDLGAVPTPSATATATVPASTATGTTTAETPTVTATIGTPTATSSTGTPTATTTAATPPATTTGTPPATTTGTPLPTATTGTQPTSGFRVYLPRVAR